MPISRTNRGSQFNGRPTRVSGELNLYMNIAQPAESIRHIEDCVINRAEALRNFYKANQATSAIAAP